MTRAQPIEIVAVVDHHPGDDTFDLLKKIPSTGLIQLRGMLLSPRVGHQDSILAGMKRARGKSVICMDGDFQHPFEVIPKMLKLVESTECSVVLTERLSREGESFLVEISSRVFYWLFRSLSKVDLRPGESDFRLIRRDLLNVWIKNFPEIKQFHRAICRSLVPDAPVIAYVSPPRSTGYSKFNFISRSLLLINSLTSFSKVLLFVPTVFACCFLALTLGLSVIAVYDLIFIGLPSGWLSLFLLISFSNTAIFFALSIIAQYLSIIFDETKRRSPRMSIDEF